MKRIRIAPAWRFSDEAGNQLDPKLFVLLKAVHRHGKLTRAAETAGISYRHAWNLLHRWGDFFGVDLVELERGRGARLSPLGEKLLWAEQRVSARLGPQLESLGSELNLAIQQALEGVQPVLRLHASHGYAVELLPEYLEGLRLDLQYCSPREALAALNRGACDLAGFHLPRGKVGSKVSRSYRDLLKPRSHRLIGFITRQQGLMVAPGNPKGLHSLEGVLAEGVRFINRQAASGIRHPAPARCSMVCWRRRTSRPLGFATMKRRSIHTQRWPPMWLPEWPMWASGWRLQHGVSALILCLLLPRIICWFAISVVSKTHVSSHFSRHWPARISRRQ